MEGIYTFPADACEALAMLYVQRQDITGETPESLYGMYLDALERIVSEKSRRVSIENGVDWVQSYLGCVGSFRPRHLCV